MVDKSNYYETKEALVARARDIVTEAKAATEREIEDYRRTQQNAYGSEGVSAEVKFVNPDTGEMVSEDEFRSWLHDQFEDIPTWFESRGQPEPNDFKDIATNLDSVQNTFGATNGASENPDLGAAEDAKDELDEWSGVFATNLQDNMLAPMDTISKNHGKIAKMLYDAIKGSENIYRGQRRDLSEAANKTIDALKKCGEKDGDDVKFGLTVVAALTGVVAAVMAVPTAGASAAAWIYGGGIALATIGAGSVITNATVKPGDGQLGGKTVNEVIDNLSKRLGEIDEAVGKEEDKVVKVLSKNYEVLTAVRQLGNSTGKVTPVMPMRPKINDAKNPEQGLAPEGDQQ